MVSKDSIGRVNLTSADVNEGGVWLAAFLFSWWQSTGPKNCSLAVACVNEGK